MLETNNTEYLLAPCNWSPLGSLTQLCHLGINQQLSKVSMCAEFIHIVLDEKDSQ